MRWLPVKLIVMLDEVVSDLYMAAAVCCFIKNVSTLLYPTLPPDETGYHKS